VAFVVLLHPRVARELEKIAKAVRQRIKEHLLMLKDHPEQAGKQLKYSDFWSLRVGDYRAIYEIDRKKRQVIVLFIGHRKKVYDDFSKLF
jgi:mRNA interferase RelE/StbE